ncbi:hypothetical protein MIR68_011575 [Amoeboaphelidium protococcarum]|nr:hypothetical protein MIR68_011575 [Amoeboaphelidium protococcarum]
MLSWIYFLLLGSSQIKQITQHPPLDQADDDSRYFAASVLECEQSSSSYSCFQKLKQLQDQGLVLNGQIGSLQGHYLWSHKRSLITDMDGMIGRHFGYLIVSEPKMLIKRSAPQPPADETMLTYVQERLNISDPDFERQWHLINRQQLYNDINVTDVWISGVTGQNVTVAIIDDGVDYLHDDIAPNFCKEGSYDFNDRADLPMPRLQDDTHGTRCAGEVAAARNSQCGVGVAFDAKISGIRLLSKVTTDTDEALAINFASQINDIYSCSWGPLDDGQHVDGPNALVQSALKNGIITGRNGLGSIFVFASGNGGRMEDDCNYDGYVNSIYTVSVGAIDRKNQHQQYSESCSALLTSSYSGNQQSAICTTDIRPYMCTDKHTGTSAAGPLVAGMIALALQIRPDLTWRDIQHLTVRSSVIVSQDDQSWSLTYSGRMYSNLYGYGKLDAYRIVENARNWTLVSPQVSVQSHYHVIKQQIPYANQGLEVSHEVTPQQAKSSQFGLIEHVTVTVHVEHQKRGDLSFKLRSPNNVESLLGKRRYSDYSTDGFRNWTFTTVKHWGEPVEGVWTLVVEDMVNADMTGTLEGYQFTFYGQLCANCTHTAHPRVPLAGQLTFLAVSLYVVLALGLICGGYLGLMYCGKCNRTRKQAADYQQVVDENFSNGNKQKNDIIDSGSGQEMMLKTFNIRQENI